jgi:hypothetical protein
MDAHVNFTRYVNAREGVWAEGFGAGKYTDDTEMTLGLVRRQHAHVMCKVRVVLCAHAELTHRR